MNDTHETAPTRFAQASGVQLAYRRFGIGRSSGVTPSTVAELAEYCAGRIW